jgi:hypothetical protein
MTRSMFKIVVAFLYGRINQTPIITVIGKAFWDVGHAPKDQSNRRKRLPQCAVLGDSIRILDSNGAVERVIPFNETERKL